MNWSEILVPESISVYNVPNEDPQMEDLNKAIFKLLSEKLPTGYKWRAVWCDGQDHTAEASNLLANALIETSTTELLGVIPLSGGDYIRGSLGKDQSGGAVWIRFGVGCPMDSGCDEILVAEFIF